MDPVIISFILLFITVTASRIIAIRGMALLKRKEQQQLMDVFKTYRLWNLVAMFGFAIATLGLMNYSPANKLVLAYSFFIAVMILLSVIAYKSVQELRGFNFNEKYIKTFIISNVVRATGIGVFFVYILNFI